VHLQRQFTNHPEMAQISASGAILQHAKEYFVISRI
jgi:hypothetical protein